MPSVSSDVRFFDSNSEPNYLLLLNSTAEAIYGLLVLSNAQRRPAGWGGSHISGDIAAQQRTRGTTIGGHSVGLTGRALSGQ
jgi:hypothetical protein